MQVKKKLIFSLIVMLMVTTLFSNSVVYGAEGFIGDLQETFGPKMKGEEGKVPLVTYISEGGVMVGEFWYNSNLFENDTDFTSVLLASPTTGIITSFSQIKGYPLADNWKLGGDLKIIKYNDIKAGAVGNDSADEEISEEYFAALEEYKKIKASGEKVDVNPDPNVTENKLVSELIYAVATDKIEDSTKEANLRALIKNKGYEDVLNTLEEDRDKLDGYRTYEGWNNKISIDLTYELNQYNSIVTQYAYEELTSQASDYKSDTISLAWENENVDDKNNPRQGHKLVTRVKKSVDLFSRNGSKDWDYTKYTLDARKYIPVLKESTLAVRMRTQSTTGDSIIDRERSALEAFRIGNKNATVTTYAPFFDMSLLGDLNTMRGYRYYRFYDNNSVLYQSEFRFPLDRFVSGLQGTVFAEAGRVSEDFDADLFTKDMHYSGGVGFKYFFNQDIVARLDLGYSEEGTQVRMNIGQTF